MIAYEHFLIDYFMTGIDYCKFVIENEVIMYDTSFFSNFAKDSLVDTSPENNNNNLKLCFEAILK